MWRHDSLEAFGEARRESRRGVGASRILFRKWELGNGDSSASTIFLYLLTHQVTRSYSSNHREFPGLHISVSGSRMEVATPFTSCYPPHLFPVTLPPSKSSLWPEFYG